MEFNEIIMQNEKDKGNKIEKDKTFGKLQKIQSLLRKESALSDLSRKI